MASPTLDAAGSSLLFTIPLELRRHIYQFCIPQNLVLDCFDSLQHQGRVLGASPWRRSALPQLLLICRRITEEAEAMLYAGNTFRIWVHWKGEREFSRLIQPAQRAKLRKVILIMRCRGECAKQPFRINLLVWDGMVRNLSSLKLAVEPPEPHARPGIWPRSVRLAVLMGYLGKALPAEAHIAVDANGDGETEAFVEKALPGRFTFM